MASSSEVITSSVFSHGHSYDVFINFRGVDTRENFVCLLYDTLKRDGIHTFVDGEEFCGGEEIRPSLLKAIRGSKISIPVFSEHYADSKYCLLELAQIWDCYLTQDQTILPIFIDVEPRDVGHQSGSFEGPFQEYKSKCEPALGDWKNALAKVGKISGWYLKRDATIKDQLNIVEKVVQRVLRELDSIPLYEGKVVGIDSHVNELLRLLCIGSDNVRFVGICGMGGLGKTTIAEVVYNRIFKSFKRRSFITDVREEASQGNMGLVSLQKRLLKSILDRECNISNVLQGKKMIAEKLNSENILLILDDVNDHIQLDALVGGFNWFGQGSKVIITTRDEHLLNVHVQKIGKDIQIYKPEEMNIENSLKLFSWHAFSMNKPPEEYKELSHEVVNYAEGLPLTLEVLGSFLVDKSKEEWKDTLKRLKDIDGKSIKDYDDKVFEKLLISYNQLGDTEKTIFLDVACNFNGWKREEATEVWEACDLDPRLAIKELLLKHLLKIDVEKKLKMHDQLRHMGISIIKKDGKGDPTKYVRLWSKSEMRKALKEDKGTLMVEGIFFESDRGSKDVLSCEVFQKMANLRFLDLFGNIQFNEDFSYLPSKLRWFRWHFGKILPKIFYHTELVHLNLSHNEFERFWNDPPQNDNKRFKRLKVLNLINSEKFSISPNFFSWFPCLQRLDLSNCHSLSKLPNSFCRMVSLKTVILHRCWSLEELPTSIGYLTHLVRLDISKTGIVEVPDSVGQLEKLEELDISDCRSLVKLPTSMARMRSLHHFYVIGTTKIKFPDDFSKLPSLLVLRMGKENYMSFQLDGLSGYLSSFPVFPSTLTHLDIYSFVSQPDVSNLKELEKLSLRYCKSLEELPDLSNLRKLRKLEIIKILNVEEIHGLEGAEFLEDLCVYKFQKLRELRGLSMLKRLRKLVIGKCENLEEIHGLEGAESLEDLTVYNCSELKELRGLSKLKRLRNLFISKCNNLKEIHGLEGKESLEELAIDNCEKLRELRGLSKLKRLRTLKIDRCRNLDLQEIYSLEGKESLDVFYTSDCYNLTETTWKIHGKGTLVNNVGEVQGSNSVVDDEIYNASPILCFVFAFNSRSLKAEEYEQWFISLEIDALIRRGEMRTRIVHFIRTKEIKFTHRDVIYLYHMKGCDWFGFPLESKNAIEKLTVRAEEEGNKYGGTTFNYLEVKFVKVLFENKESDEQIPNQESSATLVADFFRWSSDAEEEEEIKEKDQEVNEEDAEGDEEGEEGDEEGEEEDADDVEENKKEDKDCVSSSFSCLGICEWCKDCLTIIMARMRSRSVHSGGY